MHQSEYRRLSETGCLRNRRWTSQSYPGKHRIGRGAVSPATVILCMNVTVFFDTFFHFIPICLFTYSCCDVSILILYTNQWYKYTIVFMFLIIFICNKQYLSAKNGIMQTGICLQRTDERFIRCLFLYYIILVLLPTTL